MAQTASGRLPLDQGGRRLLARALEGVSPVVLEAGVDGVLPEHGQAEVAEDERLRVALAAVADGDADRFRSQTEAIALAARAEGDIDGHLDSLQLASERLIAAIGRSYCPNPELGRVLAAFNRAYLDVVRSSLAAVGGADEGSEVEAIGRLHPALAARIAHKLRTPLASVKAYAEVLLDEVDRGDPAVFRQFLSVINDEADRLARLIDSLLGLEEQGDEQAHPGR